MGLEISWEPSHKIGRDHISCSLGAHRTMKQFSVHPTNRSILVREKEATPSILSRGSFCPHSLFLFPGQQGLDKVWAFFLGITVHVSLGARRLVSERGKRERRQTTWGKIRTSASQDNMG
ncbi:Uncharacterized protein HZ326_25348 [Fusarium oxysporum f. sp. albedinis]|nr:Uncharacterized protein HZ326_25348 [Fusarium oxysporum f. sp. albedinis]